MEINELIYVRGAVHNKHVSRRRPVPTIFLRKEDVQLQSLSSIYEDISGRYNLETNDYVSNSILELKPNEIFMSLTDHLTYRRRFKHANEREFVKKQKKSVPQLILYWETVWLVGSGAARRCAGWVFEN
ncbi:1475_t:CDS:1 [Acaulospora morrowiae]|uniref:1475_t:CDS:1 n=1 Tax=Acaulospora morrowiae TaxID=94023 RepID=A0A9N9F421_9GLOM|nr:1475_t:CDS:1 [Acaulospora morrowiae]